MDTAQQHHTLKTALKYGGSFYRALASAGLLADTTNRQTLLEAFPMLEQSYGPGSAFYEAEP